MIENSKVKTFNYVSVQNLFWIDFKPHLISFGFDTLPKDIHFTISFNEDSKDINFHITRNVTLREDEKKPFLKIIVINKKMLENVISEIALKLINSILEPIAIDELKEKYNNQVGFLSFNKMEKIEAYSVNSLYERFKEIIKIQKRNRLKFKGKVEETFLNFITDEKLNESILNEIEELKTNYENKIDGGIVLTEDKVIYVIRINEIWYNFNLTKKPDELIKILVEPKIADYLIKKIKKEINIIQGCNNEKDSEKYNNPIRLEWL